MNKHLIDQLYNRLEEKSEKIVSLEAQLKQAKFNTEYWKNKVESTPPSEQVTDSQVEALAAEREGEGKGEVLNSDVKLQMCAKYLDREYPQRKTIKNQERTAGFAFYGYTFGWDDATKYAQSSLAAKEKDIANLHQLIEQAGIKPCCEYSCDGTCEKISASVSSEKQRLQSQLTTQSLRVKELEEEVKMTEQIAKDNADIISEQSKEIEALKNSSKFFQDAMDKFAKERDLAESQLSKIKGVDAEQLWDSNCYRASLADLDQLMMPKSGFLTAINKLLNP